MIASSSIIGQPSALPSAARKAISEFTLWQRSDLRRQRADADVGWLMRLTATGPGWSIRRQEWALREAFPSSAPLVLLFVVDKLVGLRVLPENEAERLDLSQHGEEGYDFNT
jgi:hypothetical protein